MSFILEKLVAAFVLLTFSALFGVLPYLCLRCLSKYATFASGYKMLISLLNCFSGGIFFATSVLGLLPCARMAMEDALKAMGKTTDYPIVEMLMGLGFGTILLIENFALTYCGESTSTQDDTEDDNKISNMDEVNKSTDLKYNTEESYQNEETPHVNETILKSQLLLDNCHNTSKLISDMNSFVLVMALSIHMIFEGLELGLLESENEIWSLLFALTIHKSLLFFSLGLTLCETYSFTKMVLILVFTSIICPIGIGIGIILTSQGTGEGTMMVSAILQGFAVGTFLYVTFYEILFREFQKKDNGGILRAIVTVVGFSIFAFFKYIVP